MRHVQALPPSRSMLVLPRQMPLLTWGPVKSVAKIHAWTIAILFFLNTGFLSVVCAIPLAALAFFLFLFVVVSSLLSQAGLVAHEVNGWLLIFLSIIIVMTSAAFVSLNGLQNLNTRDGRLGATFSRFQYVLVSLNVGTLHNWLLMNQGVARYMAEKSATNADPVGT